MNTFNNYIKSALYTCAITSKRNFNFSYNLRGAQLIKHVPKEDQSKKCPGCGARIQSLNIKKVGFLPKLKSNKSLRINKESTLSVEKYEQLVSQLDSETKKLLQPKGITLTKKDVVELQKKEPICVRCYDLQFKNKLHQVELRDVNKELEYLKFLKTKPHSLIVYVVDIIDLPGSFLTGINNILTDARKIILVGNKYDLISDLVSVDTVDIWLRTLAKKSGVTNILNTCITSAKTGFGMEKFYDLVNEIIKQTPSDIYLIGTTNAGKSQFVNKWTELQNSTMGKNELQNKITTSIFPGTTIKAIKTPFYYKLGYGSKLKSTLVDTPGITHPNSLLNLFSFEQLKQIYPKKPFEPKVHVLKPSILQIYFSDHSLFIGNICRVDNVSQNTKIYCVAYVNLHSLVSYMKNSESPSLDLTNKECMSLIVQERNVTKSPKLESLKLAEQLGLEGNGIRNVQKDICLLGLGWIGLVCQKGSTHINIYSPNGLGINIRDPLVKKMPGYCSNRAIQTKTISNGRENLMLE